MYHSLGVIISEPEVKDSSASQFSKSLVCVLAHGVEVLVGFITKTKNLKTKQTVNK